MKTFSQLVSLTAPPLLVGLMMFGCKQETLFTLMPPNATHITFSNQLTEGPNTNVLMYEYFYNGGGVAAGDLNGDGLADLYFTANMADNKLYVNEGNWEFEDVTDVSGAGGRPGPWKTGITMADVNGDSRLDIYLCYSGKLRGEKRINQLFINEGNDANGRPHFSDQAVAYGLADTGYSTQAYFFDMDHDGDLDVFLLQHNPNSLAVLDETSTAAALQKEDPSTGPRLLENRNNHFTDITRQAGINSSSLSYGLGAGIADIDGDGWQDIYVSNDYAVPDYLYINNRNGTFTDQLKAAIGHNSHFSMGNDIADVNNDGLPDIYTLDMLPEDNRRQKLLFAPDNYEKFDLNLRSGFHYQYMRNMLQVNNGGYFSEVGQWAGCSNTDWSWAPLLADYNNDGYKDLLVTNGYLRDYTNMDFIRYMNDYVQSKGRLRREDVLQLVHEIPSSNLVNYLYANDGEGRFTDVSKAWGMHQASNSNGAAYADLDNDGDLDLVINNINQPAFVYRNETKGHYLRIQLVGQNTGAKIMLYYNGQQQYLEQMPTRGYLSTVSDVLHAGLGKITQIDSLRVVWVGGKEQVLKQVKADQLLVLKEENAKAIYTPPALNTSIYKPVPSPIPYQSPANTINDFKRQPLLINPLSFNGPCLVKGDINGDGLEDLYAAGGHLYIQQPNGSFTLTLIPSDGEDADAVFFDANADGHTDLYVASGGYHNYQPNDTLLQDRLYLNDGKGNFRKTPLPPMLVSKSCVRVNDVNKDGHPDLFVGGRVIPGRYPQTPESFLLINDGKGHFTDQIRNMAPTLKGMITDAAWVDMNKDGKNDLVVVGEWMPVQVFIQQGNKLVDQTSNYFTKTYTGWWNKLLTGDLNKDGHPDLVIGNAGLNTQCRVLDKEPAELFYKDFDDNGAIDPIFCFYIQGKSWPYLTRDELLDQVSMMRTRFADYKSYAGAALSDIFSKEELDGAGHLQANYLKTALFLSDATGKLQEKELPGPVQYSPVYTITAIGNDLLFCGNINHARLRSGNSDANYGVLCKGDGKGHFSYVPQQQSGFKLTGDVRSVVEINGSLLFGINQKPLQAYKK